ncbi:hypothetical protein [Cytobacillus purgationiresistens]|nr:hypothetical protein [Cytobacillus purgationiresistens]
MDLIIWVDQNHFLKGIKGDIEMKILAFADTRTSLVLPESNPDFGFFIR